MSSSSGKAVAGYCTLLYSTTGGRRATQQDRSRPADCQHDGRRRGRHQPRQRDHSARHAAAELRQRAVRRRCRLDRGPAAAAPADGGRGAAATQPVPRGRDRHRRRQRQQIVGHHVDTKMPVGERHRLAGLSAAPRNALTGRPSIHPSHAASAPGPAPSSILRVAGRPARRLRLLCSTNKQFAYKIAIALLNERLARTDLGIRCDSLMHRLIGRFGLSA